MIEPQGEGLVYALCVCLADGSMLTNPEEAKDEVWHVALHKYKRIYDPIN